MQKSKTYYHGHGQDLENIILLQITFYYDK